jgi:F-type H+-transporting ATPase subunit delta
VASNNRSSGTAAFRYAAALVDLAQEQGAIPQIEKDIADFQAMMASSEELRKVAGSPLIGAKDQAAAVAAIADKAGFSHLTKNFLMLLANNRRLREVESILKAVKDNIASRRGEVKARVESAAALTDAQKKSLEESLAKTMGRPAAIEASVNKELIGGVVITLGSLMIDDSVKSKLERLGRAMKTDSKAA